MKTAKCYDLRVDGQTFQGLSEADVANLFRNGSINSSTACRPTGSMEWQEVNEYLPLLKYGIFPKEGAEAWRGFPRHARSSRSAQLIQWKVGLSCFAAGLLCAGAATTLTMWDSAPEEPQPRSSKIVRAEPLKTPLESRSAILQELRAMKQERLAQAKSSVTGAVAQSARPTAQVPAPSSSQAQPTIDPVVARPLPTKPEEATISLEKWTVVKSAFGSFRVKIREEGPSTISVWTDYSDEPRRIEKVKGFEATGGNSVQIHSLPGAKVYYVDRLTAPVGHCVLKVAPET